MTSTRIVLAFFFTILYEFGFCHPPPSTKKQVALLATAAGGDPDGLIGQHLPRVPPIADVDDATWSHTAEKVVRPPKIEATEGQVDLQAQIAARKTHEAAKKLQDAAHVMNQISMDAIVGKKLLKKRAPPPPQLSRFEDFQDETSLVSTDVPAGVTTPEDKASAKPVSMLVARLDADGNDVLQVVPATSPAHPLKQAHAHAHSAAGAAAEAVKAASKAVGTLETLKADTDRAIAEKNAELDKPRPTPAQAQAAILRKAKASAAKTVAKLDAQEAKQEATHRVSAAIPSTAVPTETVVLARLKKALTNAPKASAEVEKAQHAKASRPMDVTLAATARVKEAHSTGKVAEFEDEATAAAKKQVAEEKRVMAKQKKFKGWGNKITIESEKYPPTTEVPPLPSVKKQGGNTPDGDKDTTQWGNPKPSEKFSKIAAKSAAKNDANSTTSVKQKKESDESLVSKLEDDFIEVGDDIKVAALHLLDF